MGATGGVVAAGHGGGEAGGQSVTVTHWKGGLVNQSQGRTKSKDSGGWFTDFCAALSCLFRERGVVK